MELLIVSILFLSSFSSLTSYPKNSEILPKDYYKRQVLQPIPGYIPVYIKADGEPLVRLENINEKSNVDSNNKAVGLQETNEFRKHDTEIPSKESGKKFQTLSEGMTKDASNILSNKFGIVKIVTSRGKKLPFGES